MCKKVNNKKTSNTRIDVCIKDLIKWLNRNGFKTKASCCGHGKYPLTVVVEGFNLQGKIFELFSNTPIPRIRNFYKRDGKGYYYIPEVSADSSYD